jgi:hypothetical protein
VASGSSAKKIARLAQKGKGKKVRFQDGTVFPAVMAIIIIIGVGLVSYARQAPAASDVPPIIGDRWHIPFGVYKCDAFLDNVTGNKAETAPSDPNVLKYGVYSDDDGIIHWHPQLAATGKKAKLGAYLDTYGIKVDTKGITFPADQNKGVSYTVENDLCKDKNGREVEAQVQVIVWSAASDASVSKKFITDFKNVRISNDEMAITVAFIAPGADIPQPPSVANLKDVVAAEFGAVTTTTTPGATTTTTGG